MLRIESLSAGYGEAQVLREVSVQVAEGEVVTLVGRNGAGKSTLVSVLTGLLGPDSGEVLFGGTPAPSLADRDAWRQRVACVYQKSTIIGSLSVAENMFLNRLSLNRQSEGRGPIRWSRLRQRTSELLETYDLRVDPRLPAAELTVEDRQLLEIARALSFGARFIILDEPTAQLDGPAIERLFSRMRALQVQGVTFLYISHHLQEIYQVCQDVTVFRDARHILTAPVGDVAKHDLVEAMTGERRSLAERSAERRPVQAKAPVLELEKLSLDGFYDGVSLRLSAGEVVGLAGTGGSGKVALAESVVGLRGVDAGTVWVNGRPVSSVPAAIRAGLGFVPQDRNAQGLVPLLSVAENATLPISDRLGAAGFIPPAKRRDLGQKMIDDLAIKTDGPEQPVNGLSGGNAQKVVMARALANRPRALVLISPTAGVDVRSKEFLLDVVDGVARAGTGVLVVSDELDDLRTCDRVLVMVHGKLVRELARGWADADLVAIMEGMHE